MTEQKKKLMTMLTAAVKGLSNPDALVPVLQDLGRRHVGYRVTDDHYVAVGAALLWTLSRGLGERFDAPTEDAWAETYTLVATVMKDAAAAV